VSVTIAQDPVGTQTLYLKANLIPVT